MVFRLVGQFSVPSSKIRRVLRDRPTFKRESALVVPSSRRVAKSTIHQKLRSSPKQQTASTLSNTVPRHKIGALQTLNMTTEEIEESQSGVEDSGVGGPGAPTPLSALEVSLDDRRAPRHD
jgi:hypothetical protein